MALLGVQVDCNYGVGLGMFGERIQVLNPELEAKTSRSASYVRLDQISIHIDCRCTSQVQR